MSYNDLCKLVNKAHKMQTEDGDKQGYQTYLARVVADAAVKKYLQENEE